MGPALQGFSPETACNRSHLLQARASDETTLRLADVGHRPNPPIPQVAHLVAGHDRKILAEERLKRDGRRRLRHAGGHPVLGCDVHRHVDGHRSIELGLAERQARGVTLAEGDAIAEPDPAAERRGGVAEGRREVDARDAAPMGQRPPSGT